MKILRTLSVFLVFTVMAMTCTKEQSQHLSIKIDRLFIPVLYYVSIQDFERAEKNLDYLSRKWNMMKVSSWVEEYDTHNEAFDIDFFDENIELLRNFVERKDRDNSIYIIEDIQEAMSGIRMEDEVDYLLDDIYHLRSSVAILRGTADDVMLDLCEWEDVEWIVEYIEDDWYFIRVQDIDTDLYQVNQKNVDVQMQRVDLEIKNVKQSMGFADRELVAHEAKKLEKEILGLLCVFGGFQNGVFQDGYAATEF